MTPTLFLNKSPNIRLANKSTYTVLTAESVLCTCLANSDTTDKWWYWPDTDTDTRINAGLWDNRIGKIDDAVQFGSLAN